MYSSLSLHAAMDARMVTEFGSTDCSQNLGNTGTVTGTVGAGIEFAAYDALGEDVGDITAAAVDRVHGHTVLFVGTSTGAIARTHIQGVSSNGCRACMRVEERE